MAISYVASRILDAYPHLDAEEVEERLAYGSFASIEDRFVFVEVPKAACTTMKSLLRELHQILPLKLFVHFNRQTRREMFIHARENIPYPSLNALDKKDQRDLLEAADVMRFAIVRNPYTRLVSAWRDKVFVCDPSVECVYGAVRGAAPAMERKQPIEFEEFVSYIESRKGKLWDGHWRRQVDLIFPKGIPFTHIGKVEDLSSTITLFGRHLGRQQAITISRANEGWIRPMTRYSKELARRVYALYEDDFVSFGYAANSWPRDQQCTTTIIAEERFVDEVIERNVIIAHLYSERDQLMAKYNAVYRFSLARIRNKLRRILMARD